MAYSKNILSGAFNRAPGAAVEYLGNKVSGVSFNWFDTLEGSHEKAFVVAKAAQGDVLNSIRGAVEKSLEKGETFADFQKNLEPTLRRLGWWGKNAQGDVLGTPYRLKNIYRTNIQQSFNAGREKRLRREGATRPFAEYVAVLDSKTRPSHGELDGIVCPIHDPFWSYYTPSNGYQCRCRKRGVSERAVERRGLSPESFEGKIGKESVFVNKSLGIKKQVAVVNVNGVDVSPDPGFSSNPVSKYSPQLSKYPPKTRKPLEKDLKRAPKTAKKKAAKEVSKSKAKKSIKLAAKPKDFDSALKGSEKFLKKWDDEISPVKSKRVSDDVFEIEGVQVSSGDKETGDLLSAALKKRSFRGQAVAINALRKDLSEGYQVTTIDRISQQLTKKAKAAEKAAVDGAIPSFKDYSIGKTSKIGEDLFETDAQVQKALKSILSEKTASDQLKQLKKYESFLYKTDEGLRLSISLESRLQIHKSDFVQIKGNFLGGGLQDAPLPKHLDPTLKKKPSVTKKLSKESALKLWNERSRRASEFYRRNVAPELWPEENIAGYSLTYNNGGSYYKMKTRRISYDLRQNEDTIVHEIGHHFHDKNPRIGKMIEEFFRRRTKGEKIQRSGAYKNYYLRDHFSDSYPGSVYGGEFLQFSKKDGTFDFDAYKNSSTGKNFQLGTETFTRGIQWFFFDRANFYATDPEYFEMILSILRGEIPE